jgi:hypothetical protein
MMPAGDPNFRLSIQMCENGRASGKLADNPGDTNGAEAHCGFHGTIHGLKRLEGQVGGSAAREQQKTFQMVK